MKYQTLPSNIRQAINLLSAVVRRVNEREKKLREAQSLPSKNTAPNGGV